jgi:hypothetical protein
MIGKTFRKLCITLIFFAAVFISTDCKKQIKCGCGKDVYITLTNQSCNIYFGAEKSVITAQIVGSPYVIYNFCNPTEMAAKLVDAQYGDVMLLSGDVYYDCTSVYQQSNSGYSTSLMQYFQVQVSDLTLDMYGKKSGSPVK